MATVSFRPRAERLSARVTSLGIAFLLSMIAVVGCSRGPAESADPCPIELISDSEPVEAESGTYDVVVVEAWLTAECRAEYYPGRVATEGAYLLTYSFTNTTQEDVQLGHSTSPAVPQLLRNGESGPFISQGTMDAVPYEIVPPGGTAELSEWANPTEEPGLLPDEVRFTDMFTQEYLGSVRLKEVP